MFAQKTCASQQCQGGSASGAAAFGRQQTCVRVEEGGIDLRKDRAKSTRKETANVEWFLQLETSKNWSWFLASQTCGKLFLPYYVLYFRGRNDTTFNVLEGVMQNILELSPQPSCLEHVSPAKVNWGDSPALEFYTWPCSWDALEAHPPCVTSLYFSEPCTVIISILVWFTRWKSFFFRVESCWFFHSPGSNFRLCLHTHPIEVYCTPQYSTKYWVLNNLTHFN